jgi:hypothetical protein
VHDKRFALCAKFFEYIFEPVVASKNSMFYQLNFHKYIANSIYISYICNDSLVVEMLNIFEKLIRKKDTVYLDDLIELSTNTRYENCKSYDHIMKIISFIKIHKDVISKEVSDLQQWTADLSITSLNALFSSWGESQQPIIAYCDKSKPINDQKEYFDSMIGRTEIIYSPFFTDNGKPIPITYNLKSIHLVDSKINHGVQLADIIATAASYSIKPYRSEDEFARKVNLLLLPRLVYGSVFPNFAEINLAQLDVQLNAIIFEELIYRSNNQVPILENLEFVISSIYYNLQNYPIKLSE